MRVLRAILSKLYLYILWAFLAVLICGTLFTRLTDTVPARKVTLYADVPAVSDRALAWELEKEKPEGIRMIQVHPFSYAMFDSVGLKQADLYIIPDSHLADYRDWLSAEEGIPVSDPATGFAAARDCFLYEPDGIYRIYTGGNSVHLEDGLARRAAELLVSMTGFEKEENP